MNLFFNKPVLYCWAKQVQFFYCRFSGKSEWEGEGGGAAGEGALSIASPPVVLTLVLSCNTADQTQSVLCERHAFFPLSHVPILLATKEVQYLIMTRADSMEYLKLDLKDF